MLILWKKTSGFPPETEGNPEVQENDAATIKSIIDKYQNHSSILNIKNNIKTDKTFDIPHATTEQINKIIKNLNPKKATGPDKIPPKILRLSADIIDCHITNFINKDVTIDSYSGDAKTASVRPMYKKKERKNRKL